MDGPSLLPRSTIAPGVEVWMAMQRFEPEASAATTGAVRSTLTKPFAVTGIVARTAGSMPMAPRVVAPLSLQAPATAWTVSAAAVLVLTT
jgi:hypothetical protein